MPIDVPFHEFYDSILTYLADDHRPILYSPEDKDNPSSEVEGVVPWDGKSLPSNVVNQYFSLAAFSSTCLDSSDDTVLSLHALYAVKVDVKVGPEEREFKVPLPPSWEIQLTPDKRQVGYILKEPVVDPAIVKILIRQLASSDPKKSFDGGPLCYCAKFPEMIIKNSEPYFRMLCWEPSHVYSVNDIIESYSLDFTSISKRDSKKQHLSKIELQGIDEGVYAPKSGINPVVEKLKERGYWQAESSPGKHIIHCQNEDSHAHDIKGMTFFNEPEEPSGVGHFQCLHASCEHKDVNFLLKNLGIPRDTAKNQPLIMLQKGQRHLIAGLCAEILVKQNSYYQNGAKILKINFEPGQNIPVAAVMDPPAIVNALSTVSVFEKPAKNDIWQRCDPPLEIGRDIASAQHSKSFPNFRGFAYNPLIRPDGLLCADAGYDRQTGLYCCFDEDKFSIPESPSKKDAERALEILKVLIAEFPYVSEEDQAAALSAILTATIRQCLPQAPMFHFKAPCPGSGKSYHINLVSFFTGPELPVFTTYPSSNAECTKLLLSILAQNITALCFDNLTNDLRPYESLCTALTEPTFTSRKISTPNTSSVSTNIIILSSGNNVNPVGDMTRRVLPIRLDPACEAPVNQKFTQEPVKLVRANREQYVAAALTVIRAWIVAGRPKSDVEPVVTYSDWSDLCRQPLLWLGCPDPASNIFKTMEKDPDREQLGQLLHAWRANFGRTPIMLRDAVRLANRELMEIFKEISGGTATVNNRKLGKWISKHAGRLVDSFKFERDSSTRSAEAWRVVEM